MARQDVAAVALSDALWGEPVFVLATPVQDQTGTSFAALAGPVLLSSLELEEVLSQAQVGEHGVAYLIDDAGQILASAPSERARSSLAGHTGLEEALGDDGPGATLCYSPQGERMTLAYAPVDYAGLGWRVLVEQPWREVIGPVLRYSQFMPLVAALAVIVSLLTLYYGVRAIARPLQALGQEAERVAWGDFGATSTPVGGVQEIEDLRRTLDQMAKRIQSYQSGMHDYIAAITQGQEEERRRLARELHDDTAQALIALRQQVEMAQKLQASDPEQAAERLTQVRALLSETVEGVRRFSRDLRPIYLEDLGFIPALEILAREGDQREALSVQFSTTGQVRRLAPDLELAAYRIVQEALNNALQHAQAAHVWVEVHFEEQQLVLSVRDDGQGFDAPDLPDALARQGHFGLMGIRERALLYGGQLTIRSVPDEGTQLTVRLPYPASG
jgi:signal transduction histidine kinase